MPPKSTFEYQSKDVWNQVWNFDDWDFLLKINSYRKQNEKVLFSTLQNLKRVFTSDELIVEVGIALSADQVKI